MRFVLNKPFESVDPTVEVDAGLPAGSYRFQLVVQSESGLKSMPAEMTVVVTELGLGPLSPLEPLTVLSAFVVPAPVRPISIAPVAIRSAPDAATVARPPAKRRSKPRNPPPK